MRFAFYGRMSTREYQDRVTSLHWQREVAEQTIAGREVIVAEYFDAGCSRRLPWSERSAAAALLAAMRSPERAFAGNQFRSVLAVLGEHGVQVWLPEAGGPVDLADPTHQALLALLGAHSRREVVRARHRVWAAMRTQTCVQGRFLGGRPPYGYRLVDAGPHPNPVHAQWGRRLHRLEPDPVTAPWVRWIFAKRAVGRSVASIARELNERGVPCPSGADRARNRHRSGAAWLVRTIVGILENPRYTGRQVWNRHSSARRPGGPRPGGGVPMGEWTAADEWVVSQTRSHPALVDDATFLAVQGMRTARKTQDGGTRTYLLAGLVVCGPCGRRMDSHTATCRPGYRCRHGYTSARTHPPGRAKSVYIAEQRLLTELRGQLGETVGGDSAVADYLRSTRQVIVVAGRPGGSRQSTHLPLSLTGWGK